MRDNFCSKSQCGLAWPQDYQDASDAVTPQNFHDQLRTSSVDNCSQPSRSGMLLLRPSLVLLLLSSIMWHSVCGVHCARSHKIMQASVHELDYKKLWFALLVLRILCYLHFLFVTALAAISSHLISSCLILAHFTSKSCLYGTVYSSCH